MSPLRLLLWPFAFALSAYRSWKRADAERERAMLQAVAERLARGVRLVEPGPCDICGHVGPLDDIVTHGMRGRVCVDGAECQMRALRMAEGRA